MPSSQSLSELTAMQHSIQKYRVSWICALQIEYVVAQELLDETFLAPSDLPIEDDNAYTFGRIERHYVVVACLAMGKYGLVSAASLAKDIMRSFPAIRFGLMV